MMRLSEGEPTGPAPSGGDPPPPVACADGTRRVPAALAELERAVRAADPAALLVLPRILRRVIKQDRGLAGFGLRVPHRKGYAIGRDALLQIVEKAEIGLAADAELPEKVILLARPSPQRLADSSAQDLLVRCWRLLFHARVHLALEAKLATVAAVRGRIGRLGPAEFDEIRMVLGQEDMLLLPRSELSVYVEFAATYLELRHFAPSFLPRYFPGLEDFRAVDALLGDDVDAEGLFAATRPSGAADPHDPQEWDQWADLLPERDVTEADAGPPALVPSGSRYRALMRRSQRPASLGNVVRAAICHARAVRCAPPELAARAEAAVKADVHRLAARLQAALELEPTGARPWEDSLLALVRQTPRGIWTVEARLLYDLQKACVDHERDVYTIDVVEWALSLGRRPMKRRLPAQRDVLMLKHLRSAARRLAAARIAERRRRQLARLLRDATARIEARLREQLRGRIVAALDDVGLLPRNLPERVARKKLVEELLDRIVDQGFLAIGDLRDAISRNNLKLPDLLSPLDLSPDEGVIGRARRVAAWLWRGTIDFLHGDQLLRADRRLALGLDGVYRRGEIYMRWMQRLSSPGFGTGLGRFLTRFAVIPFGGAFVTVAFVHAVWDHAREWTTGVRIEESLIRRLFTSPQTLATMVLLGLFLLGLMNSSRFRQALAGFFKGVYLIFDTVLIEPIRWIVRSPLVQQFFHSRLFTISFRLVIKPLIWTTAAWWALCVLPFEEADWRASAGTGASLFLAFNLLLNSRLGRTAEEVLTDWIVQGWHRFGVRWVTGLFWFFVDVFRSIVETVERLIYSVDEWLRFRSGDHGGWLMVKAVMGTLWFFVAYVLRFAVNVLLEPQINPIKHFPVVTVGHKLLLGAYGPFVGLLEKSAGMGKFDAWIVGTTIIWCIPGIFGFLVWELKENWRLYAANRRPALGPVMIGAHGETMGRLLRPGFHSGTLPKRYAKLRLAERHARTDGGWRAVHKHLQALRRAELALRRYVEREFLELFAESRCWGQAPPQIEAIRLDTNSVRLTLRCDAVADGPLRIAIDAESGWLLAGVSNPGWAGRLLPQQRQMVTTALLGLYKTAGIELVRQQIEGEFPPPVPPYDVSAEGLVFWPDEKEDVEVLYDLHEGPWIAPQSVRGLARRLLPTVERGRILFSEVPVAWQRWVEAWEQDLAGQGHPRGSVAPVRVLP